MALGCLCAQGAHAVEHRRVAAAAGAFNYALVGLPQAAGAYGVRQLSPTYTGCAIIVRRQSDSGQKTICFVAHQLDTGTAQSFCAATTCYVATWFDQSGNGNNMSQSIAGLQPTLVFNSQNGHPTIAGSSSLLGSASMVSVEQPYTFSAVAARTGLFTSYSSIMGGHPAPGQTSILFSNSANAAGIYAGAAVVGGAAADNAFHSLIGVANTTSSIDIDGTTTSGNAGTVANVPTTAQLILFDYQNTSSEPLTGNIAEAYMWTTNLSTAQQAQLRASEKAYWGTP